MPFRLVQRLHRSSPRPEKKGVDRYFSMDYMGSAEFEFGALPDSLGRMRRFREGELGIASILVPGFKKVWFRGCETSFSEAKFWFLGCETSFSEAEAFILDQIGPQRHQLQEPSRILPSLLPDLPGVRYAGWWAVDAENPWMLFVKKDDAKLMRKCVLSVEGAT